VTAAYIKDKSVAKGGAFDTAFYVLQLLNPEDLAGIANAIHDDPGLAAQTGVFLPKRLMANQNVPAEYLTDMNVLEVRSGTHPGKSIVIMVNIGDDKSSSTEHEFDISEKLLSAQTDLWVDIIAAKTVSLDPVRQQVLKNALKGLWAAEPQDINAFAEYAIQVAKDTESGANILDALGNHLPNVDMPKCKRAFAKFNSQITNQKAPPPSAWKREYEGILKKVRCYYVKQNSSGAMLTDEQLEEALANVTERHPSGQSPISLEVKEAFQAFIRSSGSWNDPATQVLATDFDYLEDQLDLIFKDLKAVKSNLAKETRDYFENQCSDDKDDPHRLSDAEKAYLDELEETGTTNGEADDDDIKFYQKRRSLMANEALRAKWEKFVFPSEIECSDFVVGLAKALATLLSLTNANVGTRKVIVHCAHDSTKHLSSINPEAGLFFITRYQGLMADTKDNIEWNCDRLLKYREKFAKPKTKDESGSKKSKAAKRIRFTVQVKGKGGGTDETIRLNWHFDDTSVACCLHDDLKRLAENPFTPCVAALKSNVTTGQSKPLNLLDVGNLTPAYGLRQGSFVPRPKPDNLKKAFETALATAPIPQAGREAVQVAWQIFSTSYSKALKQIYESGFETAELIELADFYGHLIKAINFHGRGDRVRNQLLKPILAIGNVTVQATKMLAVVTPWHPLRLASIKLKTKIIHDLAGQISGANITRCADKDLLTSDIEETIKAAWLPELTVHWTGEKPNVLCQIAQALDYSAYECPKASIERDADSNDDPTAGAEVLKSVVEKYLRLYPHERDSLSAVLYNCDSALLPSAAVDALSKLEENEDEPIRCQIILRHRIPDRLRHVYEKITDDPSRDPDALVISEVTEDFMARLRIEIHIDQVGTNTIKGIPPHDIVFLQDVLARNCEFVYEHNPVTTIDWNEFKPSRFGRRRPLAREDTKTITYLVSPVQTQAGWDYITAIHTLHAQQDWDKNEDRRYIPQRKLTFSTAESISIFDEVHKLGNWVVNYDSVLDRRMLINRGIKVIRFKQASSIGRNIIISSQASFALLESMVESRLKDLNLQITDQEIKGIALKMLDDANFISGDLALRAARRSINAGELMGVVLSSFLAGSFLGSTQRRGWFFVDDYAEWLGQKEGALADLLAIRITPSPEGTPRIDILVTEAKFVADGGLSVSRNKSKDQVLQTIEKLHDALVVNPPAVDQPAWLAKLGEMIVGGIDFSNQDCEPEEVERWRDQMVTGKAKINVVGLSHIFCSTPNIDPTTDYLSLDLKASPRCFQEEFGFNALRDIVIAYWENAPYRPDRLPALAEALQNTSANTSGGEDSDPNPPVPSDPSPKPPQDTPIALPAEPEKRAQPEAFLNKPWPCKAVAQFIEEKGQIVGDSAEDQAWLGAATSKCRTALQRFGMDAIASDIAPKLTPNAALIRFKGTDRLNASKVRAKTEELLTQFGLDVVAVQSEPLQVCITIARPKRAVLKICDVWKSLDNHKVEPGGFEVPIAVREDNGEVLVLKPTTDDMPHTLIAGESNSGKSVLIRNILLGIACTATPQEAHITIIDAKSGVDFTAFTGLPHLTEATITTQEKAIEFFHDLIAEMERRYDVLAQNGVENIVELHKLANPSEHLPIRWIIHDEFADWMQTESYREEVPPLVARLGIKARAAGIYLIFAAQRPDSTVMPMQLRDNLGNKLCLKVNSPGGAEIVLGMKNSGAERLLGKGHMLAKLPRSADPIYCQVPFVEREEIKEIVKRLQA
jgi:S-DNA-T family DNA segregation ATPase FtsK/SpoIIIE